MLQLKQVYKSARAGAFAMPYIEWASHYGIANGAGNIRFAPNGAITREQMAVMMVNYAHATGNTLPISRQAGYFTC